MERNNVLHQLCSRWLIVDGERYLFRSVEDTHNLDYITPQRKQQAAVDISLTMLWSFRRLGMGQSTKPSIPGMQVVDWQVVEFKSGKGLSVLALKNSKLYVAAYLDDRSQRTDKYTDAPLEPTIVQHPQVIELAHIFPEYTSQFALYCENSQSQREIYIKKRNIMDLFIANGMPALQTPRASQITEHEATICDRLSFHQHPNIAEFLGVQVSNVLDFDSHGMDAHVPLGTNRITGLVFTKYDCTLHELITRRQKVNVRLCLQSVWAGIQFLHRVGVVHGDIRPHNIFVKRGKDKDHFVIGDFDCAQDVGKMMSLKVGDPRWTKRKAIGKDIAKESDDWSGFIVLKEWLVKETGGKLEEFKEIGRNRPVAK